MKLIRLTVLLLFISTIQLVAQTTNESLKKSLSKEWKIQKYETFSVVEMPKPDQVNDKISLKEDMSFIIVENGKEYTGKWTIMNPNSYISCKSTKGDFNKSFKILSYTDKEAVFEYKDPDLIKTKYYLAANL